MKSLSLSNPISPLSVGNGRVRPSASSPFTFQREMDQLLDEAFGGFGFTRQRSRLPAVEVHEAEKEYVVTVDLPGVELKDIDLSFSDGVLSLKAERKAADNGALYSNRWSGAFERAIGIDTEVDESQIRATLKNGVLAVTLPKKPERLPRRIEVQ